MSQQTSRSSISHAPITLESLEGRQMLAVHLAIGAIGDSYTDEYRFYAPDRSTARNYVEQLAEDRSLDFGSYTTGIRSAPRNAGFKYNWAQSGDTSGDMLADGQVSGLAAQAAAGKVNLALIFAGGNDFRGVFSSPDPLAALGTVVPTAVTNVFTAVNTLLGASPKMKVVVATVPKVSILPEVRGAIAAGVLPQALADAVDTAIGAFDAQIRKLAASSKRITLADVDAKVTSIFSNTPLKIDGVKIDLATPSDNPTSLFLADGIHAGTVGQGLLANVFIGAINYATGRDIRALSQHEILENAGLPRLRDQQNAAVAQRTPAVTARVNGAGDLSESVLDRAQASVL